MSEHLFGTGAVGEHSGSEMLTDSGGHLVSNIVQGDDGSTTFTDSHGMVAGTITHDLHGTHYSNMAGQELSHVDHNIIYDAQNLPMAQMFTHGTTTDLSDMNGNPVGHIIRTPSGSLSFDGGDPPHQVTFSTKL